MKPLMNWQTEVRNIQSYLDESYDIEIVGIGSFKNFKSLQLPWARVIVEKFTDRLIPVIKGGTITKAVEYEIDLWIRQAVQFGNASIIVSSNGTIRIPSPLNSLAQKAEDGSILFYEETPYGQFWGWNEELHFRPKNSDEDYLVDDAQIFTIFYDESSLKPYGQSRLSDAIRYQITWASRVLSYAESVSYSQSHTQLIFTNINQDIMQAANRNDSKSVKDLRAIKVGIHDALMLGDSDSGNETKVNTIDPTDPSGLLKVFERIAATVASSRNLEPREFGNTAAVAPSAEAQHASKEDLVLEVKKFSKKIKRTVLAFLYAVAEANGEEEPELQWGNPATPSEAAQMDAFSKAVQANPAAGMLRSTHIYYGWAPEIIDELEANGWFAKNGETPAAAPVVEEVQVEVSDEQA